MDVYALGELVFVGLGLYDENDISLRGLKEIKEADAVFAEFYTSLMPGLSIRRLEKKTGKTVRIVSRRVLEEENGKLILQESKKGKAVFLVPGDPMIATTHVDLRIRAQKQGIKNRIVHGASAISAVMGIAGLQNYKFGRSVTIPFSEKNFLSEAPYNIISENKKRGLHTMCYLDIKAEEQRYMTIKEALQVLLELEKLKKTQVLTSKTLVLGVARVGSSKPAVKAGYLEGVMNHNFGAPPQTLIFPGKLHFMEAEALITLADAPDEVRRMAN